MSWEFQSGLPIYTQLVDELRKRIVSGYYRSGDRLASVRELALEARVNPNTMQKALTELERQGLVYTVRTTGRFITDDTMRIEQAKAEFAAGQVALYYKEMAALGYCKEDMIRLLSEYKKEDEE